MDTKKKSKKGDSVWDGDWGWVISNDLCFVHWVWVQWKWIFHYCFLIRRQKVLLITECMFLFRIGCKQLWNINNQNWTNVAHVGNSIGRYFIYFEFIYFWILNKFKCEVLLCMKTEYAYDSASYASSVHKIR